MTRTLSLLAACSVFALGCTGADPVAPESGAESHIAVAVTASGPASVPAASANPSACWGQATAVFAQMGLMGEHASEQPTPRAGLRNLAHELYEMGVIGDDSMAALGAFVASALGLSVDACMS